MDSFNIRAHLEFDSKNRAICPCCQQDKGAGYRKRNLSVLENGAYKCHRGCTPDDIRAALGTPKVQQLPTALAAPISKTTVTPSKVQAAHTELWEKSTHAINWLRARLIHDDIIRRHKLGIGRAKCGEKFEPAIIIPIPANPDRTAFYQKKRIAPWIENHPNPEYKPWSQFGIPALCWFTYQPEGATATWLCEGEWDAMLLGDRVQQAGLNIAVATFTTGAQTVPSQVELDKLPGTVHIFYDQNDTPDKHGNQPGAVGAIKVAAALGDRARICAVPMPADCVSKWDVTNAIAAGYTVDDFTAAAATGQIYEPATPTPVSNPLKERLVWNDDLMARAPDYTEWLVQDILTADELFLLAAGPRAGKSLLAMTLAKAVAEGSEFLGRPCTQGNVIYVCLEDGDAKLKERELAQGWGQGLPVAWLQKFKLSELPHLVELAEELDPRLIILDTLSRIKDASISESSAEMSQVLEPLQEMAKEKGCCVLLVHHTGKVNADNANAVDVFDTIRGSSAIRAVCRGSLIIASAERSYRLYVENGWKKLDLSVVLDGNTWTWKLLGQWKPDSQFNASQKDQIIECLKQLGQATIDQIHESTQIPRKSLYEQLSRLQASDSADEKVIKEGSRRKYTYRLALFNTIQQLNSVLNRPNSDSESDSGYIQQKNISSISEVAVKSDHDCNCNDDHFSVASPPTTFVEYSDQPPSKPYSVSVSPIQQPIQQPVDEMASNPDGVGDSRYSTDIQHAIQHPSGMGLQLEDTVEVLTGRFSGKHCLVKGFTDAGLVEVRAGGWAITREYVPEALRLIRKSQMAARDRAMAQGASLAEALKQYPDEDV